MQSNTSTSLAGIFWIVLFSFSPFLWGQSPEEYYKENCELCHTIGGGDQLGPDLQGVSKRQSREWLVNWLLDPEGVLASGDVYANEMLERYGGLPMFPSPGMDRELANALLDYIDEQSALVGDAATQAGEPPQERAPPPSPQDAPAADQATEEYYTKTCLACHTIGGGALLGPDLKDLSQRQSREWLVDWLLDPEGVLASGDPYAVQLQRESRGAVMPRSPGINRELAIALLDYIDQQSGLVRPEADDSAAAERPLTLEDVEKGRALFSGRQLLENGGPACIACHNVTGLGGLAGGRLGPDLTRAYATLGGRPALSAWLSSPPSPTMIPIYQGSPLEEDEIIALIAYLQYET